jgi:hypothetical protein
VEAGSKMTHADLLLDWLNVPENSEQQRRMALGILEGEAGPHTRAAGLGIGKQRQNSLHKVMSA